MITITPSSLISMINTLKLADFDTEEIYLSDETYHKRITHFHAHLDHFEVNGMYQSLETKYTLTFNDLERASFWNEGGELRMVFDSPPELTEISD